MNIKKIYFDMRMGQAVIFPIISMINFIIISYSLTDIGSMISMQIYMPTVIITMVIVLIVIGSMFRKKQQATDISVVYENNVEFIKDMDALMSGDKTKINARQEYHKKVLKRHTK